MKLTNLLFIAILAIFAGNAFAGEPIFPPKEDGYSKEEVFAFMKCETAFARENVRLAQNFRINILQTVQNAMNEAGYKSQDGSNLVLTEENLDWIAKNTYYEYQEFEVYTNSGKDGQEINYCTAHKFKGMVAVFRYGRCAVVLYKVNCGNPLRDCELPTAIKPEDPVITENTPKPPPEKEDVVTSEEPQILVKKKQPVALIDEQQVTTTDDGGIYVKNGEQEVKISASIAKGANNIVNISNHTTTQAASAPVEIRDVPVYYPPAPSYTCQDNKPYEPPVYYPPVQQKPVKYKPERNGGGWLAPTLGAVGVIGLAALAGNNHRGYISGGPCRNCNYVTGYQDIPSSYPQSFSFAGREFRKGMNGQYDMGGPKSNKNPW